MWGARVARMAAVDFFIKFDGIKGESTDAKHKDEIDVESWSFGETNAAGGGADRGDLRSRAGCEHRDDGLLFGDGLVGRLRPDRRVGVELRSERRAHQARRGLAGG